MRFSSAAHHHDHRNRRRRRRKPPFFRRRPRRPPHHRNRRPFADIWQRHRSSTGLTYYYNPMTDQSQWEKPPVGSKIFNVRRRRRRRRRLFVEAEKLTPTSPPAEEIIPLSQVDPSPTVHSEEQLYEDILAFLQRKQSLKASFQSLNATCSPNGEAEHGQTNSDGVTRYYRGELIEHLLNWPVTQLERDAARQSNEQSRLRTCQLISLRTQIYFLRLRFERNRLRLLLPFGQHRRE